MSLFSGVPAEPPSDDFIMRNSMAPGHWNAALGEYVLDWDEVVAQPDSHGYALDFARAAFRHACLVCGWDPDLAASAEGDPPPVA